MAQYEIGNIDLVIVDLYPFEATVASGASAAEIIEKIDIGGISLIRAAAKNFNDVVIVSSKTDYAPLLEIVEARGAETTLEERRAFATHAFATSSHYDTAIHAWFEQA
jgi:phosphoribosylaminoimidazolecarboxamide formyltransferase/IMP cyclohydrolase